MTFEDLYTLSYNSIIRVINYIITPDKRIYFIYLISSFLFAYYVYHFAKIKYSFLKYIFNKKVWFSSSAKVDYWMLFLNGFIKVFLIGSFVYYGLYIAFETDEFLAHTFGLSFNNWSKFEIMMAFTIAITIFKDFSSYLLHLLQHKWSFLWEFHKIHHSAKVLNPITQYRIHPVELIVNNIVATCVFGLTMGFFDFISIHPIREIEFLGANIFSFIFLFFGANLRHSHVKLRYYNKIEKIFISPFQHQIHHSNKQEHFDKNLGAKLAIWDWMFGTLIRSKSVNKIEFGLGKEEDVYYDSFLKNVYMPFVNLYNKWIGNLFRKRK